jgi:hypothetical protein
MGNKEKKRSGKDGGDQDFILAWGVKVQASRRNVSCILMGLKPLALRGNSTAICWENFVAMDRLSSSHGSCSKGCLWYAI